jgi:hypothetical protein
MSVAFAETGDCCANANPQNIANVINTGTKRFIYHASFRSLLRYNHFSNKVPELNLIDQVR